MARLNWNRVLLGGLLAGAIINAVEITYHTLLLGSRWWFFRALADPTANASAVLLYIGRYTLVGVAAVWLYAVARPRFGPGPKTALGIAAAFWVIGYVLPVWGFYFLIQEEYRTHMWRLPGLVALVEVVVGTLGGAWLYREP